LAMPMPTTPSKAIVIGPGGRCVLLGVPRSHSKIRLPGD
jgi:hypothetical protein